MKISSNIPPIREIKCQKNNFTGIKFVLFIHCIYEQVETREYVLFIPSFINNLILYKKTEQ
ncbi:hypothetical protein SAMN06265171_110146 [Chryseobacterium rhizoplanae]|uniref:Uncharacterized protein n=1 Tax=Chryseobacterium rhizoplanae TaxID=1609531 RepID=A0A521EZ90_9FLAO|nr:hypothetical protein SAMN06265171_110146 [Chryseobacterium rhizoplanae]